MCLCRQCNVVFALMMNQRTNCVYRKMHKIIQSGELGAIRFEIVCENGKLVADGREGIRAVMLSNAMHLSAWTGKEIDLRSFDHELYYEDLMKRVKTSRRKTVTTEAVVGDMSDTFGS